ncbi:Holliday junction branch migration protein RuvA [Victivallis sp. Marseille-Q1083]|uniref:Holliday junction branch migration protein RuvA n=1 Tax=Victivallis sp. Marseille-Q1083 TaxID=2717288 RepID=UPI001589736E|nr:Holliday junction branch migration protein RuvA [Victivallis sp. Marseille-Q1083]
MIAKLYGILDESNFTSCIVNVQGVGYLLSIPLSTFDRLPLPGEAVTLLVCTQVREDAITLFGFATPEEKALFELLITVSGIGGKLALSVLSSMPVGNFCSAIGSGDVKSLSRISGVGKRTAERLIVDLRDKVTTLGTVTAASGATAAGKLPPEAAAAVGDAGMALEQLGFKRDHVNQVLQELAESLPAEELTSENLLRRALLALNRV